MYSKNHKIKIAITKEIPHSLNNFNQKKASKLY